MAEDETRRCTSFPSDHSTGWTGERHDRAATVLLADDDDALRETLALWLRMDGRWLVREAADGAEALTRLDGAVDVLVLDRRMPRLSGTDVLARLDGTSFSGPVVVLSSRRADESLNESHVARYLTKPIRREKFLDHLEGSLS